MKPKQITLSYELLVKQQGVISINIIRKVLNFQMLQPFVFY
jgi:hypothetical protein